MPPYAISVCGLKLLVHAACERECESVGQALAVKSVASVLRLVHAALIGLVHEALICA